MNIRAKCATTLTFVDKRKPQTYPSIREALLAAWDIGVELVKDIRTPTEVLHIKTDVWRH